LLQVATQADRLGVLPGVLTFDCHPKSVIDPDRAPKYLTRADDKVRLLLDHGAAFVAVLTSTASLFRMRPASFVEKVLLESLGVRSVVVGPNFRFGHRALGDPELLRDYRRSHGLEVCVPSLVTCAGDVVSSSAVRNAVAVGAMRSVAGMLGRPHEVRGLMVPQAGRAPKLFLPVDAAVPPPELATWTLHADGHEVIARYCDEVRP
jgi:riboflavin kinase/FMN adenylyltransferase